MGDTLALLLVNRCRHNLFKSQETLRFVVSFELVHSYMYDGVKNLLPDTALPTIVSITPTSNPVVGEEFSIECTVAGTPLPSIGWQFNDRELEDGDKLRIVETSDGRTSSVEVSDATTEFSGVYKCIVRNAAGSVNQSVRIELQRKSL